MFPCIQASVPRPVSCLLPHPSYPSPKVFFTPRRRRSPALFTQGGLNPLNAYDGWLSAQRVCVIGAGTMGGGIAAHLANLGFEVTLPDLSPDMAREASEKRKSARPPHFYLPEFADRIRLGNIREHLGWVSDADWVCEAIVEKSDVKRGLFAQIEPLLRPDAMISTNTSGLQISLLAQDRSPGFKERFL